MMVSDKDRVELDAEAIKIAPLENIGKEGGIRSK
jgi:hypothetical protein